MNLRDLQYFAAVAQYQHFGRAAEACFVSQPALSMQLQKLEDTLGIQLFERNNKQVMITQVGKHILERAQTILQEAEDIKEIAKTYQDPFSGTLTLGAFPTLAPYFFPDIIPKLSSKFPKLQWLLVEEKTDILIEKLQAGEIDAAFLALPIDNDALEYTPLFEDVFFLATSLSHTLATRTSISEKDLQHEHLMLLEDGHCLRNQALDVCSLIGSSEQQDFRATSLETLRQMVASGSGITLIPKLAQKNHDQIRYIPFDHNPPSRHIAMVWRKTSARKICYQDIANYIKQL